MSKKVKNFCFILISVLFTCICFYFPYQKFLFLTDGELLTKDEFINLTKSGWFCSAKCILADSDLDDELNEYVVKFKLFNLFNIKNLRVNVSKTDEVLLGGDCVGLTLKSKGVVVVGSNYIVTKQGNISPFINSGLKIGDVITNLNGNEVNCLADIQNVLNDCDGNEIFVDAIRNGKAFKTIIRPEFDIQTKSYKLGIWISEDAVGVGTLTFINPENMRYGCLGHAINGAESEETLQILNGEIYKCNVVGVKKGAKGVPGEILGLFIKGRNVQGNVDVNNEFGVYGNLKENAELVKEVYLLTEQLKEELKEAYQTSKDKVVVIDDVDEEVVTDEPIVKENTAVNIGNTGFLEQKQEDEHKEEKKISPYYAKYSQTQKEHPEAIVVTRLGDFYEIMGDNAKVVSERLDLTLTGRDVGLDARVPMVGFPYHAADKYIESILIFSSVIILDKDEEPKYILSNAQVRGEEPVSVEEDEESEEEFDDEIEDYKDESVEYFDDEIDEPEIEEKPEPKKNKGSDKLISERKKKEKPQLSFFDILGGESQEDKYEQLKELMIETELKSSHRQHGCFEIYDYYLTNPSVGGFAKFIKDIYGIGGSCGMGRDVWFDGKGIKMSWKNEGNPLGATEEILSWTEVAHRIADLIDENKYFDKEDWENYEQYKAERIGTTEERIKAIVDGIIKEGVLRTKDGYWQSFGWGDLTRFVREHNDEIIACFWEREEVISVEEKYENYYVRLKPEYCKRIRLEEIIAEPEEQAKQIEQLITENTDLNEIGFDQTQLGGAKARFQNNVNAKRTKGNNRGIKYRILETIVENLQWFFRGKIIKTQYLVFALKNKHKFPCLLC